MLGECDWYNTGLRRMQFYYQDIGITKSILIGNTGDIDGINAGKPSSSSDPVIPFDEV